jgi:hypothetical protein
MQITPYMWQTLHQPIPKQQHFSGTKLLLSHTKHMERTELKKGCSFKVLTTRQLGHQQVIPGACKSQAKLTRAP